jgi:hypothetical protein
MDAAGQTAKCRRCHRVLRSPASIAAQVGPRCAAIEAAFDGLKPEQCDKARELLADGGVVRIRPGIYRVSSSKGDAEYLTAVTGQCSCAHGARRATATAKVCYHVATARLVAKPRRRPVASRFILAA